MDNVCEERLAYLDINLCISISSLVVACLSLIVTILMCYRDGQWRFYMIRSDVMHFCQKYNERLDDFHLGELSCLSLCAIAVSVEPGKAYRRSIYRDFCCLSEDAIRVLLRKYGLSVLFSKKGINTDCLKDYAIKKIKSYYPDEKN